MRNPWIPENLFEETERGHILMNTFTEQGFTNGKLARLKARAGGCREKEPAAQSKSHRPEVGAMSPEASPPHPRESTNPVCLNGIEFETLTQSFQTPASLDLEVGPAKDMVWLSCSSEVGTLCVALRSVNHRHSQDSAHPATARSTCGLTQLCSLHVSGFLCEPRN